MKPLPHFFRESEINFYVNSHDKDIIANASEMAGIFDKEPYDFLDLPETKVFIELLIKQLNSEDEKYNVTDIIFENDGFVFMHRKLAIKFAAWLDMEFDIWFFDKVDDILFGNYKRHWDAHVIQKSSQAKMLELKKILLLKPPTENDVKAYFKAEQEHTNAKMAKLRAIKEQYSFEFD